LKKDDQASRQLCAWNTWLSLSKLNLDQTVLQNGKFEVLSHIVIQLLDGKERWFNHIEKIAKAIAPSLTYGKEIDIAFLNSEGISS
tara:strand:+ start:20832 stop:21089 length:258 start_codon:yes stop_codon:yes gene_type:complete